MDPDDSNRYEFCLVQWALDLIRKRLVSPVTLVPLLHQSAYSAKPVVTVVHRDHTWVRVMIAFTLQ